ncbi:hypothetical protein [Nonomuraea jabiensis]|uniref:Uncharacterized protein n=1 Tax=Nonomuraea jabiensis TaxID=882448 RepID=A0A7W9FYX8_9ACTN|nr:hypothetical protein [Nonomuraea jabiensis]MBB5774091.1 hypothetical protein [Nonomuraea jabiensis]
MSDNRGMPDNGKWHEERDTKGHPMVPATPRDVAHIRIGSFLLVFLFAFAVLGIIVGAPVMTGIALVVGLITVVDIALAVRRQKLRQDGEAG